jgi:hypothetical protein
MATPLGKFPTGTIVMRTGPHGVGVAVGVTEPVTAKVAVFVGVGVGVAGQKYTQDTVRVAVDVGV